jgi:hypothetical protein
MKPALEYILSILMTFLPPRYRAAAKLRGPAIIAGILQCALAMGYLLYRFYIFSWERAGLIGSGVNTPSNLPEVNGTVGGGVFMMAEFIFNPVNVALLYFFFEGMVRCVAALVSHQTLGTLSLYAVSGIHNFIGKAKYERYVGEVLPDQVIRGTGKQQYDLKIYSSRPKLHWNPYMTIEFEEKFYQYFKEEYGPAPRRFVYYLRNNPTGRVVVVIDRYRP